MASSITFCASLLENHDLKLSHNPEKNPFVLFQASFSVSFAFVHSSWAFCVVLSWNSSTFWAAFSGRIVQATPLTESFTIFHAQVATFHAAETVQPTTVSHVFTTFHAAFHTTFVVVENVHPTTAFPQSTIHFADEASEKVSQIPSFKSCQIHLTQSTVFCHTCFKEFHHSSKVDFTEFTQVSHIHFTFSTPVLKAQDIASFQSLINDLSLFSADWSVEDVSVVVAGWAAGADWTAATLFSTAGWSVVVWVVGSCVTGVAVVQSCAGVTGVPTFCSSCVCVMNLFLINKLTKL